MAAVPPPESGEKGLRPDATLPELESGDSRAVHPSQPNYPADKLPNSWIYRPLRIFGLRLPWYASPSVQLGIVSVVCFLCPGMFNALSGMGGGGRIDASAQNKANTALYSTFAVVGFFAGTLTNRLGIRLTLAIGGLGYCVYVASFLSYEKTANEPFVIFAGALLGLCAAMLWTAQGAIMMSYPPEKSKGKYIAWFWMVFNMGAVIGSLIPLGQTINSSDTRSVSTGTYVGFLVLTVIGASLATTLVNAQKVVRADGSRVSLVKQRSWKKEIFGLWKVFRFDTYILLLFPMFFASNWFYTYQFNDVNLARFTIRTRSLNGTLYWTMQIVGAMLFGYLLDRTYVPRRIRAQMLWTSLFVITMAIWGGGFAFQRLYTRASVQADPSLRIDWADGGRYIGPMFLYMFYGFFDAAWQTSVYWLMGALTNDGDKLANFAGFYKGIQSAGAAIIWRLDDLQTPYMNLFASSWALLVGSLIIAAPVIWFKIKDTAEDGEVVRREQDVAEGGEMMDMKPGQDGDDGRVSPWPEKAPPGEARKVAAS